MATSLHISQKARNPKLLTLPELLAAKKKLGVAAAFYDPQEATLKHFLCRETMTYTEFRLQLQKSLSVHLTDEELGAIVTYLDRDGSKNVVCDDFVKEFFQLGRIEKQKILFQNKQELSRREARTKKWRVKMEETFSRLTASQVDSEFTSKDENSALDKISKAAYEYDKIKGGLERFVNATTLSGPEFKVSVRLNLGIKLTAKEAGACVKLFDPKGTGVVDCREFIVAFNRLGRVERQKNEEELKKRKDRHDKVVQQIMETHLHLKDTSDIKIEPYTEQDYQSFKKKIASCAIVFDSEADGERVKRTFGNSEAMNVKEFRDFLNGFLQLHLTPGELDVALQLFDINGDGIITCNDFLSTFYRIQWRAKAAQKRQTIYKQQMKNLKEIEFWAKKEEEAAALLKTRVVWPNIDGVQVNDLFSSIGDESSFTGSSQHTASGIPAQLSPAKLHSSESMASLGTASHASSRHRSRRKLNTEEIFSAGKLARRLVTTKESVVSFFPLTSPEIKDFILELEEREKQSNIKSSPKKTTAPASDRQRGRLDSTNSEYNDHFEDLSDQPLPRDPWKILEEAEAGVKLPPIASPLNTKKPFEWTEAPSSSSARPVSVHSAQRQRSRDGRDNETQENFDVTTQNIQEYANTINASSDLVAEMGLLFNSAGDEYSTEDHEWASEGEEEDRIEDTCETAERSLQDEVDDCEVQDDEDP